MFSNDLDDTAGDTFATLPVTVTIAVSSIDGTVTQNYVIEVGVIAGPTAPTVSAAPRPEQLRVSWSAAPDDEYITGYFVRWRTSALDPDGTPGSGDEMAAGAWQGNTAGAGQPVSLGAAEAGVGVGRVLGYTIAGLTDDAAYDVQVRGENLNGVGAWSASQSATTGDEGTPRCRR